MVRVTRKMVRGVWNKCSLVLLDGSCNMVRGPCNMVRGTWSVVRATWSVVRGPSRQNITSNISQILTCVDLDLRFTGGKDHGPRKNMPAAREPENHRFQSRTHEKVFDEKIR